MGREKAIRVSKLVRLVVGAASLFSHIYFLERPLFAAAQDPAPWQEHLRAGRTAAHEARYLDALEHYYAAQKLAERAAPSAELKGQILSSIGACLLLLRDYRAALAQMLQARPYTVAGGNREHLAALEANIATTYVYQGDYEAAGQIYRRALAAIVSDPRSEKRPAILGNLGAIELRRKRYAQAFPYLHPALEGSRAAGLRSSEADIEDLIGLAHLGLRDFPNAEAAFRKGLEVRRSIPTTPNLSRSLMFLGRAAREAGRAAAAVELLDQAVERARERDDPVTLWSALYLQGLARQDLAQPAAAAGDYRQAVAVLESVRLKVVPTDGIRVHFETAHHDAYAALAEALCELGASVEAFHAVELGRARSLRELVEERRRPSGSRQAPTLWTRYADRLAQLEATRSRAALAPDAAAAETWRRRLAEQEAALRDLEARLKVEDPVAGASFSPALELSEVQQGLGPSTLLLNFYAGERATYLWAVTRSEAQFYKLAAPARWNGLIASFLRAVETGAADREALGGQLSRLLLGPVEPRLRDRRHWILAVDGDLASLPFAALPDPAGQRYLVEARALSYTPSASVLRSLERRAARKYTADFLGIADPVLNRADPRWPQPPAAGVAERLPRLAASQEEVAACARLFGPGRWRVLAGFEASEAALRQIAPQPYRFWHFSSHVVIDPESPNQSFVALSIPPGGTAPEKLTVLDILGLRVEAEMVFLSGCDSGAGKRLPGAGVLGLARAFLAAGARSVCATRWRIPDERGELASRFYGHLAGNDRPAFGRAEALRRAQIEMLHAGDWRSQPRYWAAYFLVGSPGD